MSAEESDEFRDKRRWSVAIVVQAEIDAFEPDRAAKAVRDAVAARVGSDMFTFTGHVEVMHVVAFEVGHADPPGVES